MLTTPVKAMSFCRSPFEFASQYLLAFLTMGLFLINAPSAQAVKAPSSVWLSPGFYSYHFKRSDGLRDSNPGIGLALKYSEASSVVFGRFRNSDNDMSSYLGFLYQPYSIGYVRLGAALAAFDGYPEMRSGKAFLSVIPTLGIHGERVSLNVGVIPEIKDRVHGAVSFQLLVRFGHIPLGGDTARTTRQRDQTSKNESSIHSASTFAEPSLPAHLVVPGKQAGAEW